MLQRCGICSEAPEALWNLPGKVKKGPSSESEPPRKKHAPARALRRKDSSALESVAFSLSSQAHSSDLDREAENVAATPLPAPRGAIKALVSKKPAANTSCPVEDCPSGRFKLRTRKDRTYILKFDPSTSTKWPQFFERTAKTSAEHWRVVSAAWKRLIGSKKVIKKAELREMKQEFLDAVVPEEVMKKPASKEVMKKPASKEAVEPEDGSVSSCEGPASLGPWFDEC